MADTGKGGIGLSPDKRKLLEALLRKKGIIAPHYSGIAPRNMSEPSPLSFGQQRLWFLDQLIPDSPLYNIPGALRLTGRLDRRALEKSFNVIVECHEVLRARFHSVDGQPVQSVNDVEHRPVRIIDLSEMPSTDREACSRELILLLARLPFDLSIGPLLRAFLLRLGPQDHILHLTMHHIASDGWSLGILIRTLADLYKAFTNGEEPLMPVLPIQYTDFAQWQRHAFQDEVLESQTDFWKKQLAGRLPVLDLPADRPRPSVQSFRGAFLPFDLPYHLTESLAALSRRENVTLFTTLLTTFKILLSRYTDQKDVIVGTPFANRNYIETENLIGFFVNILVLRTDLSGNPTFRQLLHRVQEVALQAYAHPDVPFEKLVEEIRTERDLSRTPLFQAMFVLQNAPMPAIELGHLKLSTMEVSTGTSKYDLTFSVQETESGLKGWIEYNTDLFDAPRIERFQKHFRMLVQSILANPECRIECLNLLMESERNLLQKEWNRTSVNYDHKSLYELFEIQAAKTPKAVAVVFEDTKLTYGELDEKATRLAGILRSLRVGPEMVVGLMVERSLDLVIGLIGIIKAGGAYLPLDPAYPQDRLSMMIEDAGAQVILTQSQLKSNLPESSARILCLDQLREEVEVRDCLDSHVEPDNPAYVIFTPESMGRPMGTIISHRSICNRLFWMQDVFELTTADVVLQKTSLNSDASIWEIFWPLLAGARIVLTRPEGHKDTAYLCRSIAENRVTVIHFAPSMLAAFLQEPEISLCKTLRLTFSSGEPLTAEIAERFFSNFDSELHNLHGLGESATDVTWWKCGREDRRQSIPIGRPIANTQIYILDRRLQSVPVGIPGELYIGGVALARGYINRADLTAERFIPDPFSLTLGARLYRTGDKASFLPDGNIEFQGRIDAQTKIQDSRVELAEIESTLLKHPEVKSALVVAIEDESGDNRLVAYITTKSKSRINTDALREFLKQRLHDHFLPSTFVTLDNLPSIQSSKADRSAVFASDLVRPRPDRDFVAPRDVIESRLASIWEETLNIHTIGVQDNFFDLGGNSLLALRMMAGIKCQFGQEVPLASMFTEGTIERLADHLRGHRVLSPLLPLVQIQSQGDRPPFFCVHPAGGDVFCYGELARRLGAGRPFYGFQAKGLDCQQEPHARIEHMAADYVKAMLSVQPGGPHILGGWSLGATVAFEMAQQLSASGLEVAMVVLVDPPEPVRAMKHSSRHGAIATGLLVEELQGVFGKRLPLSESEFADMELDQQFDLLMEWTRVVHIGSSAVNTPNLECYLQVLKYNLQALQSYQIKKYSGRVVILRAKDRINSTDLMHDWTPYLTGRVETHIIPGNHFSMMRPPHVPVLAEVLKKCLDEILQNPL